ncbi:MAG: PAS domain-containing protein [Spirochaetota bacterium]
MHKERAHIQPGSRHPGEQPATEGPVHLRGTGGPASRRPEVFRRLLADVTDHTSMLMACLDQDFTFIWVNRAYAEASRRAPGFFPGKNHFDLYPHPENEAIFRRVVETGEPCFIRSRPFLHPDQPERGTTYWNWSLVPLKDRSGRVERLVLTLMDVTESKLAELELEESRETVRRQLREIEAIYDSAQVGLGVFDRNLRYMRVNRRLAEMNGLPAEEHIGKTPREVVPDIAGFIEPLAERIFRTGESALDVEVSGHTPACPGELRHWVEQWLPLKDENGEVAGINVAVEEVTERRRAEERLRDLNETLEKRVAERAAEADRRAQQLQQLALELTKAEDRERQRIAEVLHDDLQQMLAAFKIRLGMFAQSQGPGCMNEEEYQELELLIDQSISTSRSLSHELNPPILQQQGLLPALQWLRDHMFEKFGMRMELAAESSAEPEHPALTSVLFRSVRELLFNVIKHSGSREARVAASGTGDSISITVSDRGRGFDPAELEESMDRETGFGLFSIRERVSFLGGSMNIRSAPGQGCRIILRVPRHSAPLREPARLQPAGDGAPAVSEAVREALPAEGRGAGTIRILLADDHDVMRRGLAALLEVQPDFHVVAHASSGREAVRLAAELKPDVVVMDVSMPDMDGIQATAEIMKSQPQVSVVGLSIHDDSCTASRMTAAGASAFLNKGGSPTRLVETLRRVCRR